MTAADDAAAKEAMMVAAAAKWGRVIEATVGGWGGHKWLGEKYGRMMKSNCGCNECVRWAR